MPLLCFCRKLGIIAMHYKHGLDDIDVADGVVSASIMA